MSGAWRIDPSPKTICLLEVALRIDGRRKPWRGWQPRSSRPRTPPPLRPAQLLTKARIATAGPSHRLRVPSTGRRCAMLAGQVGDFPSSCTESVMIRRGSRGCHAGARCGLRLPTSGYPCSLGEWHCPIHRDRGSSRANLPWHPEADSDPGASPVRMIVAAMRSTPGGSMSTAFPTLADRHRSEGHVPGTRQVSGA